MDGLPDGLRCQSHTSINLHSKRLKLITDSRGHLKVKLDLLDDILANTGVPQRQLCLAIYDSSDLASANW